MPRRHQIGGSELFGFFKKITSVFQSKAAAERKDNAKSLEDILYEADLGGTLSAEISKELLDHSKSDKVSSDEDMRHVLEGILSSRISEYDFEDMFDEKTVILVLGVNGSGKTTTCAKLAKYFKDKGNNPILCASDTFRAAAGEQLDIHAKRLSVRIVRNDKAGNPAAVVYDGLTALKGGEENLLIADTAGRMHTKENLLKEIGKIDRIVNASIPDKKNYRKLLVLDATTGQNAISQAENFDRIADIDALVLTKIDSGSKGGTLIRISQSIGLPVAFLCTGEGYGDIRKFNKKEYIEALLS